MSKAQTLFTPHFPGLTEAHGWAAAVCLLQPQMESEDLGSSGRFLEPLEVGAGWLDRFGGEL